MKRKQCKCGLGAVVDGTTYHDETDPRVIRILEEARRTGKRICVRYGDRETGRDWGDMRMCGRIGRSTGTKKIPLLISTARSLGGPGLLEHVIVQITETRNGKKHKLYEVPGYHASSQAEDYASRVNYEWSNVHRQFNGRKRSHRR